MKKIDTYPSFLEQLNYVNINNHNEKKLFNNFLETELKKLNLSSFYIEMNNWNENKFDFDNNRNTRLVITLIVYNINNISYTEYFEKLEIIKNFFQEFDLNLEVDNYTVNLKIIFFYNEKLRQYYEIRKNE